MEEEEEGGGGAGWIVSFADLMTLLFAAFVVLYALKEEGETVEVLGVTSSIRESFINIPDTIPETVRDNNTKPGKWVFKNYKAEELREPIIKKFRRNIKSLNVVNNDMQEVKNLLIKMAPQTTKGGKDEKITPLTVKRTADGFKIRMISSVLFKKGSYRLKRNSLSTMEKVGKLLKELGRPISVEGHTDDIPVPGEFSNWELSALRATYVAKLFINEANFDPGEISVSGYGSLRPVAENLNAENRKLNRRVEIKVRYDQKLD